MRTLRFLLLFLLCVPLGALDRSAFTFVAYDLRLTLAPPQQAMRVAGRVTLRNDSQLPQRSVALQISSSLDWESITVGGRRITFASQAYSSDADHTGELSQAVFTLPQAVPPGGTVQLEVAYGGKVLLESGRLERLKTPKEQALRRDWDRITPDFTALRGAGYVVWYPVAIEGATLAQGDALARILADWKRRHAASSMRLELRVDTEAEILSNGRPQLFTMIEQRTDNYVPIKKLLTWEHFGPSVPTLVIGKYEKFENLKGNYWYLPGRQGAAVRLGAAAEKLDWRVFPGALTIGLNIVDLPDSDAAPFEADGLFLMPFSVPSDEGAMLTLAHPLMHAHFRSPRPWLHEGAAHFAQAVERERQAGRAAALEYMQRQLPALVAFEKEAGKSGAGALAASYEEPLFRTKAMYVLWMLRDMVGDDALRAALTSYEPIKDDGPMYFQRLVEAAAKRDLAWFFDDWVSGPGTLPELRLAAVFPAKTAGGTYMVTLTIRNTGSAAEVPVTLRSANGERTERVLVRARDKTVVRIPLPEEPLEARVNDGSVPEADPSDNVWRATPPKP